MGFSVANGHGDLGPELCLSFARTIFSCGLALLVSGRQTLERLPLLEAERLLRPGVRVRAVPNLVHDLVVQPLAQIPAQQPLLSFLSVSVRLGEAGLELQYNLRCLQKRWGQSYSRLHTLSQGVMTRFYECFRA